MARMPIEEPERNPPCYVCGSRNNRGLKLQFFRDGDEVVTDFEAPAHFAGWPPVLHGGFQAMLIDEVCCWAYATISGGNRFATEKLEMRYRRPVYVETPLDVRGRLERIEGDQAFTVGQIRDGEGNLLVEGKVVLRILDEAGMRRLTRGARG